MLLKETLTRTSVKRGSTRKSKDPQLIAGLIWPKTHQGSKALIGREADLLNLLGGKIPNQGQAQIFE